MKHFGNLGVITAGSSYFPLGYEHGAKRLTSTPQSSTEGALQNRDSYHSGRTLPGWGWCTWETQRSWSEDAEEQLGDATSHHSQSFCGWYPRNN